MKLRFTKSDVDPNHCLKVVDDRPLRPAPSTDDLFQTGADPLTCRTKRELDPGNCTEKVSYGVVKKTRLTCLDETNYSKL